MPSAIRPNASAMDSRTSTRQATKAAMALRAPASPIRRTSPFSSVLARSISYLISWDTSLAASATRSPSDWPSPAGSGTSLRTIRPISLVCGPLPALPHGSRARAFRLLLGLAHVRQSPRLAWSIVNGQHRGPVRRFRPRVTGLRQHRAAAASIPACRPVREAWANWRYANVVAFTPMCSVSPDYNVTTAHRCTSRNRQPEPGRKAGGGCGAPEMRAAPLAGAPLRKPRQAWLPSVHLLCQPGRPLPVLPGLTRLPRLVARGYLAAVPGRVNVRTTFLR